MGVSVLNLETRRGIRQWWLSSISDHMTGCKCVRARRACLGSDEETVSTLFSYAWGHSGVGLVLAPSASHSICSISDSVYCIRPTLGVFCRNEEGLIISIKY